MQTMMRKQEALVKQMEEQRIEDLKVQDEQERMIHGLLESIKEKEARRSACLTWRTERRCR